MKRILSFFTILLLSVASLSAQAVKWSYNLDVPMGYQNTYIYGQSLGDGSGGSAWLFHLGADPFDSGPRVLRLAWFNSLGKLIVTNDLVTSSRFFSQIVRLTRNELTVQYQPIQGGQNLLRRFKFNGRTVTQTDLALPSTEKFSGPLSLQYSELAGDKSGFFSAERQSGADLRITNIVIRRYSN